MLVDLNQAHIKTFPTIPNLSKSVKGRRSYGRTQVAGHIRTHGQTDRQTHITISICYPSKKENIKRGMMEYGNDVI